MLYDPEVTDSWSWAGSSLLSLGVGHLPVSLPGSSESLYQPHWKLVKPTCSPVCQYPVCDKTASWLKKLDSGQGFCSLLCLAFGLQVSLGSVDLNWGRFFYLCPVLVKRRTKQVSKEETGRQGFWHHTIYIIQEWVAYISEFLGKKICQTSHSTYFPLSPWNNSLTKC